jgi:hypothetical protein
VERVRNLRKFIALQNKMSLATEALIHVMLRYDILRYEQLPAHEKAFAASAVIPRAVSELSGAHTTMGRGTPCQGCALVLFDFHFSYSDSNAALHMGEDILIFVFRNVVFFNVTVLHL